MRLSGQCRIWVVLDYSLGDWAQGGRGKGRGRLKPSGYRVGGQFLL